MGYEPVYYVENFTVGYKNIEASINILMQSIPSSICFVGF